jgi:hypothetical protein
MKKFLLYFLCIFGLLTLSACLPLIFFDDIPELDKVSNRVTIEFASRMKKKHGVDIRYLGGGAPSGKLSLMKVAFTLVKDNPTIDEVRILLFDLLEEFLQDINASEPLKPFLEVYPFTFENVDITIYFENKNGDEPLAPYVCSATIWGDLVSIGTRKTEGVLFDSHIENYNEALSIINAQKNAFLNTASQN